MSIKIISKCATSDQAQSNKKLPDKGVHFFPFPIISWIYMIFFCSNTFKVMTYHFQNKRIL